MDKAFLQQALDNAGTAGDLVAVAAIQIALNGEVAEATDELLSDDERARARAAAKDLSWLCHEGAA